MITQITDQRELTQVTGGAAPNNFRVRSSRNGGTVVTNGAGEVITGPEADAAIAIRDAARTARLAEINARRAALGQPLFGQRR